MSADDTAQLSANVAAVINRGGLAALAALPALRHLIRSPTLPLPQLLHHLNGQLDEAALARRAADPNEPPALLTMLAGAFPAAFCANPVLPLLLLENPALPATFDSAAHGRLLSYAGVPRELLMAFVAIGTPEASEAARLHIGLAGEASDNWETSLREAALRLPTIPDDDLLAVLLTLGAVPAWLMPRVKTSGSQRLAAALAAAGGDWTALVALAHSAPNPAVSLVPKEQLTRLLESEDPAERALAAADPRVPVQLLLITKEREDWTDVDYAVYEALALNPAAPPELLTALAHDRSALNTRTRRFVALHPHAPHAALALLADEPYAADIRLILAAHPNLAPEQRTLLLDNSIAQALATPDPVYRAIALGHPSTPHAVLADYADAPNWLERVAVAMNPHTPSDTRQRLAEDGNRLVRAAAQATEQP